MVHISRTASVRPAPSTAAQAHELDVANVGLIVIGVVLGVIAVGLGVTA